MEFLLLFKRPWPYRHPKKGRAVMVPGAYRVPADVAYDVATRAIAEGVAERRELPVRPKPDPAPIVETSPAPTPVREQQQNVVPPAKIRRKRGKRRKGPAPENRSLGRAPEDRQTLV